MIDQTLPLINAFRNSTAVDGTPGRWINPVTGNWWDSIELEWLNNQEGLSCIPEGEYLVQMQPHPLHGSLGALVGMPGMCYEIMNVPGRTAILVHIANWAGQENSGEKTDLLGCVGLGKGLAKMIPPGYKVPQEEVVMSTVAIEQFYKEMGGKPFRVSIKNLF
jgi:hypothetical protein